MGRHGFEAKRANSARRQVARALAAACVFFALSSPDSKAARAGEPTHELEQARLSLVRGEGADGCFAGGDLEARVRARLGRDPFSAAASKSIEVFITRGERGFVAKLFARSGRATAGARELASDAEDCAALESAVILAVALTIDPDAALRPPPPPSATPTATAPPPIEPPRHEPPVVAPLASASPILVAPPSPTLPASPTPPSPWHSTMTASLVGEAGFLPGVAPGMGLGVEVRRGLGIVRAAALFFPETKTSDGNYAFGASLGALAACVEPARGARAALAFCGGLAAGAVHAVPFVNTPTRPGDRGFLAFEAGARLELLLAAPLVAAVSFDGVVPAVRYKFLVQGLPHPVYEQAAVGGLGAISLGASFP